MASDAKESDCESTHTSRNNAEDLLLSINWNLCILCQNISSESLQCPAHSKRKDVGAGYHTLAEHYTILQDLQQLPIGHTDLSILGGKEDIGSALLKSSAKWHATCNKKYALDKVKRAQKRKSSETPVSGGQKYTLSLGKRVNLGDE